MPTVRERAFDRSVIAATARPDDVEQEIAQRWRLGRDHEVLGDREVVEELERLPRAPEAGARPPVGRQRFDRLAVEHDPARRRDESRDAVDGRRLACPVRPDDADELPAFDAEVEVVDGAHAAERDREAVGLEERAH